MPPGRTDLAIETRHDPYRLVSRERSVWIRMVVNQVCHSDYTCASGKEWEAEHTPYSWRRHADPAQAAAGGTGISDRIRERAWGHRFHRTASIGW